jgi:hypothetical protein
MSNGLPGKRGAERRKKQRIQLTRAIVARLGAMGAVILDITDAGARIEHFTRLDIGKRSRLRFEWQGRAIEVEANVVSCKIHRFAHGDDGATVYQSGLMFTDYEGNALTTLRELVSTTVSRSLAEQVANARGIGPVTESHMPVFRDGVMATERIDSANKTKFLPKSEVVVDRGYVRCTLIDGRRWEKKWSRTSEQPGDGFTVLATEPAENVDQLCESYYRSDHEQRELIRVLARISVEAGHSQGEDNLKVED